MNNPGLTAFAVTYTHPRFEDIRRGDPDFDPEEEEGEGSDWVPFSGWRRDPGQPLRVAPGVVGKPLTVDQAKDVIHGEVISPEEQDAAERIIHGEHESNQRSANPDVAAAQSDLHTEDSDTAVRTLSDLLAGAHPSTMSPEAMDAAHRYLSEHFSGVTVNPEHGHLVASSPAGTQVAERKLHLPAVPTEEPEETFSLTNKHGTMESRDPERILRAMVAFQIVHTRQQQQQQKKDDDDQNQSGLTSTSGLGDVVRGLGEGANRFFDAGGQALHEVFKPRPKPAKAAPYIPPGAIFEPGRGVDIHPTTGAMGGWVADAAVAPPDWLRDPRNEWAVSGGHELRDLLDPTRAMTPRRDDDYPGHTYTYAPNPDTGHIYERRGQGATYFATKLHPAVRLGLDLPPQVKSTPAARLPKRPPMRPRHQRPPSGGGAITSSAHVNDLCPVCASGYLEPYDPEFHECLNCGSLVKQAQTGTEKTAAARPKGGLGRGLTQREDRDQIQDYTGDPLGLADAREDPGDAPVEGGYVHPLAGEQPSEEYVPYEAPRDILGKKGALDPIEEFMGKQGFQPAHKPGQVRAYIHPIPGVRGGYFRLTQGLSMAPGKPGGWTLTADNTNMPQGQSFKVMSPGRLVNRQMPDVGDRALAEKSFLAKGTHPVDDDELNRAIRDVHENGRNAEVYRNLLQNTSFEPPSAEPRGSTQRAKRMLSSTNPGLTVFADWDTTEVNDNPCTHCSGSGVDPEYGDECFRCEGSGNEPE